MFDQRWFWFALAALLFTNFEAMKLLFAAGIVYDVAAWLFKMLRQLTAPMAERRRNRRMELESRKSRSEHEQRRADHRAKELEIELERTKRQNLMVEIDRQKAAAEVDARNNRLPAAVERRKKCKELIGQLDLPEKEKETLCKIIDKHFFKLLQEKINELV